MTSFLEAVKAGELAEVEAKATFSWTVFALNEQRVTPQKRLANADGKQTSGV